VNVKGLIGKKELRQLILYSSAHVSRMEKDGRFPKRLRLGSGPRARVGWLRQEVEGWIDDRLAERDERTPDQLSLDYESAD
jgi:prophage regulatory protein